MAKYFKCDTKICRDAKCCRDGDTAPYLTIGDYIRLADHLSKTPAEIWETNGNVVLGHYAGFLGVFSLGLSLQHGPCPYLDLTKLRCDVQDVKPGSCAIFPLDLLKYDPKKVKADLKEFECLSRVRIHPLQSAKEGLMREFLEEENKYETSHFWGTDPVINAPRVQDVLALAVQAERLQRTKPQKLERIVSAVKELNDIINKGIPVEGIDGDKYKSLLVPIVHGLYDDIILRKLKALTEGDFEFFRARTLHWKELVSL